MTDVCIICGHETDYRANVCMPCFGAANTPGRTGTRETQPEKPEETAARKSLGQVAHEGAGHLSWSYLAAEARASWERAADAVKAHVLAEHDGEVARLHEQVMLATARQALAEKERDALRQQIAWMDAVVRSAEPEQKAIVRPDDDGDVDDVVITGDTFRMERMRKNAWWLAVYRGDQRVCFWLTREKGKGIVTEVTEDELGCVDDSGQAPA